jgi:hypothetical protein
MVHLWAFATPLRRLADGTHLVLREKGVKLWPREAIGEWPSTGTLALV